MDAYRREKDNIYTRFLFLFSLFEFLQTSKSASHLIQRTLVKEWRVYHLSRSRIPKPKKQQPHSQRNFIFLLLITKRCAGNEIAKTEKDVEVLQSAEAIDKG